MIDIHSHIIPGIDDGARDEADALSLLRLAEENGTTRMVLTPHIHLGRFNNNQAIINDGLSKLKIAAENAKIKVDLAAAAEVRIDAEIMFWIEQDKLPFLGEYDGQKFLLLELPHSHVPSGCGNLIKWLTQRDIATVIAHPERNRDILRAPEKIIEFQRLGCLFQLTASSLTGGFRENSQLLSEKLLKDGVIDIVASDGHNIKRRPPLLKDAYQKVCKLLSEKEAQRLFYQTPYNITQSLFG